MLQCESYNLLKITSKLNLQFQRYSDFSASQFYYFYLLYLAINISEFRLILLDHITYTDVQVWCGNYFCGMLKSIIIFSIVIVNPNATGYYGRKSCAENEPKSSDFDRSWHLSHASVSTTTPQISMNLLPRL